MIIVNEQVSRDYEFAVRMAADLLEPGWHDEWNPEYMRGMSELIAQMFGAAGVDTEPVLEAIRRDIHTVLRNEGTPSDAL